MNETLLTESEVFSALKLLFANNGTIERAMLESIEHSMIKKAYRRKALETHPDRFSSHGEQFQAACSQRFIEVTLAYETLNNYLDQRQKGLGALRDEARLHTGFRERSDFHRTCSRPSYSSAGVKENTFTRPFKRELPARPLRIGEFLYHSGVVSWKSLINALVWQRKLRPRLGEIAQRWRWINETDVELHLRDRHIGERLGELLLRHDLISPFQLDVLLWHQRKMQKPLGHFFIVQGALTAAEVRRHLVQLQHHNRRCCSEHEGSFSSRRYTGHGD
jgi:hypothetical protein